MIVDLKVYVTENSSPIDDIHDINTMYQLKPISNKVDIYIYIYIYVCVCMCDYHDYLYIYIIGIHINTLLCHQYKSSVKVFSIQERQPSESTPPHQPTCDVSCVSCATTVQCSDANTAEPAPSSMPSVYS